MKILITLLVTFFVAGAAYSYTPPDSCLKMKCPDNYNTANNTGTTNPDSVRIDTCISSPTYGKEFAKRYFQLRFTKYPFENAIPVNEVKRVSDLREDIPGLKQQFQELEEELGTFYFKRDYEYYSGMTDSVIYHYGIVFLVFEKYQEINFILTVIEENVDSLFFLKYDYRAGCNMMSSNELEDINHIKDLIFPNPVTYFLQINSDKTDKIEIFSAFGLKVLETEWQEKIDVSGFAQGVYYVRIGSKVCKFIKI